MMPRDIIGIAEMGDFVGRFAERHEHAGGCCKEDKNAEKKRKNVESSHESGYLGFHLGLDIIRRVEQLGVAAIKCIAVSIPDAAVLERTRVC